MQRNTPHQGLSSRVRQWLLSRPHVAKRSAPTDQSPAAISPQALIHGASLAALGWALTQGSLLFSVNPLPWAFVCALPSGIPYALLGILIGLWHGGTHRLLTLATVALASGLRMLLRLFFYPSGQAGARERKALRARLSQLLSHGIARLCNAGAENVAQAEPEDTQEPKRESASPRLLWNELWSLPASARTLSALLASLLPATLLPILGEFAFYDLYGALLILLLTPTATVLFSFALAPAQAPVSPIKRVLGTATLLFFLCHCTRSVKLLGLLLSVVVLLFVALLTVRHRGLLGGLACACVGGLAIEPVTLVPLCAVVLLYALMQRAVGGLALLTALLAGICSTLLMGGESLFRSLSPSLCVAILLFSVFLSLRQRQSTQEERAAAYHHDASHAALVAERARCDAVTERLQQFSGAFRALSEVFSQLGDCLQHPEPGELRHMCDGCFDRFCPDCAHREDCWSKEYAQTLQAVDRLTDALESRQAVDDSLLSEGMRSRCPHLHALLGDINYTWVRRDLGHREGALPAHLSRDFSTIASLLSDALAEDARTPVCDNEASDALGQALLRQGAAISHATVLGGKRCVVLLDGISEQSARDEQFHRIAQEICGKALTLPQYEQDGEQCAMHALPPLQAWGVWRSVAAGQSQSNGKNDKKNLPCGDSVRLFRNGGGIYYALLCDGMGTGQRAAMTSGVCTVLLERLLRAGVGMDTAMGLLNHYLSARGTENEITSTVDLLSLDLFNGKAKFVKSGAADTLILRQGRLFSVSCRTLPLGILQTPDVQVIPFRLMAGDCILMMSDGITEGGLPQDEERDPNSWLYHMIGKSAPEDDRAASVLLDRIFEEARRRGSLDDMTVALIRIDQNSAATLTTS